MSDVEGLGYETAAVAEDVVAATSDESMQDALRALLETATGDEVDVRTFDEAGVLTYNKGLVLRMPSGVEFQIEIQQSA